MSPLGQMLTELVDDIARRSYLAGYQDGVKGATMQIEPAQALAFEVAYASQHPAGTQPEATSTEVLSKKWYEGTVDVYTEFVRNWVQ